MYHGRDTVVEIRQMLEIGYKDTTQVDEHFYAIAVLQPVSMQHNTRSSVTPPPPFPPFKKIRDKARY